MTHIFVSYLTIIGSDYVLSSGRRQAIMWTNTLLIGTLGTYLREILIEIHKFPFKKMYLRALSVKMAAILPRPQRTKPQQSIRTCAQWAQFLRCTELWKQCNLIVFTLKVLNDPVLVEVWQHMFSYVDTWSIMNVSELQGIGICTRKCLAYTLNVKLQLNTWDILILCAQHICWRNIKFWVHTLLAYLHTWAWRLQTWCH